MVCLDETTVDDRQGKEVEKALNPQDELGEVLLAARNIGRLYEAFAESETKQGIMYPTFEHAVKKHQLIEDMYKQSGF